MQHFTEILRYAFLEAYVVVVGTLALFGLHRYVLVYLYMKHRKTVSEPKVRFITLPRVTVQLPMYNEDIVAQRVIRACCMLDYPTDKLEIQVLDDSTDGSAEIAREAVEDWAAKGVNIHYIHRENRVGFKAGALAEGLDQASGEFIAIFDADFVPPPDMLLNVINHFTDEQVGVVQVRWDHLNRNASLLTKGQAIFLDGHFVIEHTARNRSGRFMHFNGTAGVWRRTAINDAGGWQHDTLTEDLDLSYRAQLKGWQFVYLPQHTAPAELPPEMIGFKQQAHRWTKGTYQTCIKLLPRILRDKQLPRQVKTEAVFHLTNIVIYPLMVLLTLMIFPIFYLNSPFSGGQVAIVHSDWGQILFSASLFVMATCSASTFFVIGQHELLGKRAGLKTILYLPFLMGLGVGLGLNNTKAVFGAIWDGIKNKPSEFLRTPKYGVTGRQGNKWRNAGIFAPSRLLLPLLEIAMGFYLLLCIWTSLSWNIGHMSIPFLLIFASGYFYVGIGSLRAMYKMHREAHATDEADDITPPAAAVSAGNA